MKSNEAVITIAGFWQMSCDERMRNSGHNEWKIHLKVIARLFQMQTNLFKHQSINQSKNQSINHFY